MERYLLSNRRLHVFHSTTHPKGGDPWHWTLCGMPSEFVNMTPTGYIESVPLCALCRRIVEEMAKEREIQEAGDQTVGLPLFAPVHQQNQEWLESILAEIDI